MFGTTTTSKTTSSAAMESQPSLPSKTPPSPPRRSLHRLLDRSRPRPSTVRRTMTSFLLPMMMTIRSSTTFRPGGRLSRRPNRFRRVLHESPRPPVASETGNADDRTLRAADQAWPASTSASREGTVASPAKLRAVGASSPANAALGRSASKDGTVDSRRASAPALTE